MKPEMERKRKPEGWIRRVWPELTPPSLRDNTADVDRLIKGLRRSLGAEDVGLAFCQVAHVGSALRQWDFRVGVSLYEDQGRWRILDVWDAEDRRRMVGVALDLGSSTLVLRMLDLESGDRIDEISFPNPQIEIGADILTRIHVASKAEGLERLHSLVINRLNEAIEGLCKRHGLPPEAVMGMSVAGNTTMTHLFLGLSPYWLCREPYIPVINRIGLIPARDLNLAIHPKAPVLVAPNVGSYFGGDLIAGILASGMATQSDVSFLVDVGTNAEVVIGNRDWLMACAGAAGPALEGGVADMGMMAGPGVIDRVRIDPVTHEFTIGVIGNGGGDGPPIRGPVGICGSGLIDLAAQLFLAGMIDLRGKFVEQTCGSRLVEEDGVQQLIVVPAEESGTGRALTLSQTDMDGLIRSKAAMYTILTTIANTVNISFNEIRRFYVAGTFGSYIDPRSAITIGMIPDLPLDTYVPLGNTSLEGASMALLDAHARAALFRIRDHVTYLELNVNQEFMNLFSAAKFIPHTDRSLFPSVPVEVFR